ncbi:hypothetical protein JTE90_009265 [Oedothorax gibbosus]|uniref:Uncharacterized protein n=1 Tax=Oedothorax gibbosus TaxID=931172 RepID=A0AAV6V3I3_9ARAC|nr:hypothetical protein JTE90_009265 [Oedothorax gibbosus]
MNGRRMKRGLGPALSRSQRYDAPLLRYGGRQGCHTRLLLANLLQKEDAEEELWKELILALLSDIIYQPQGSTSPFNQKLKIIKNTPNEQSIAKTHHPSRKEILSQMHPSLPKMLLPVVKDSRSESPGTRDNLSRFRSENTKPSFSEMKKREKEAHECNGVICPALISHVDKDATPTQATPLPNHAYSSKIRPLPHKALVERR